MKNQLILFTFLLWGIAVSSLSAQENTYPTGNRLFHIERSKNRNLVCYDVKLKDGKPDSKKPLEVYWINREEAPGEKKGLSFIQEKFAYGYKVSARGEKGMDIVLKAYPGRTLTLKTLDGGYVCMITINGQPAILRKIYVQAKKDDSLSVEYVELTGETVGSGEKVSEKVRP